MSLNVQDAYAFRRVLSRMDVPENLQLSPLAQALFDALDPANNPAGEKILTDMLSKNQAMMEQVMYIDPKAPPPPEEDDHEYVQAYIQQVTTQAQVAAPDTSRTNGSTDLLMKLHQINQQQGVDAAKMHWQIIERQGWRVKRPEAYEHDTPVMYYDDDNIIQKDEITTIIGQPGAGKSFWILRKMAEMAEKMPVLYMAAEGLSPERLHALKRARGKINPNDLLITTKMVDLTDPQNVEDFINAIAHFEPKVIAFDTFAACTPGMDENSSKDIQPVLNRIRDVIMARLGCSVILVHHTTKDGKSFRGSSALRGNVANMYYLTKSNDLITLRSDKQRDSEPDANRYYRLVKFNTRLHPITGEQLSSAAIVPTSEVPDVVKQMNEKKLTSNQQTILEALDGHDKGMTHKGLENATMMAKSTLSRQLTLLDKMGYISRGGRGKPILITKEGKAALN